MNKNIKVVTSNIQFRKHNNCAQKSTKESKATNVGYLFILYLKS